MKAIELIKKWEGCKLKAYLCPAEVPTIGFGTTRYMNDEPVKITDIITKVQAERLLQFEIDKIEKEIDKKVSVSLTENQKASLISFVYNLGIGAFSKSTLLKKINSCAPKEEIEKEFSKWCKAGDKKLRGLENRRKSEIENYFL